ncbi:hypothetical protein NPIL_4841 [Nephila pilipes]|uniref:Uncharacterized protein n=1 Tax=Nephila pilipes TaxID=299642 RepID=A0A8X6NZ17_NEPPI|nr:hypothetical protein NPIL_4841 [Nephila pilipes]
MAKSAKYNGIISMPYAHEYNSSSLGANKISCTETKHHSTCCMQIYCPSTFQLRNQASYSRLLSKELQEDALQGFTILRCQTFGINVNHFEKNWF